jgi:hypothetical protein
MHSRGFHALRGIRNQVSDKAVKNAFQRLVKHQLLGGIRDNASWPLHSGAKRSTLSADLLDCEQARFVAIVQIGGVVGNLVGQVDELRFERRALVEQIFGQFGCSLAS